MDKWIQLATSRSIVRRSVFVSMIVGTLLLIINQGDVMLGGAAPDLVKTILTYLVPYCVSTYASVSAKL
ncbi:MAG: nitrate/nitrite transporter NrtS [Rhodospirillales bacterium]|nr:nitrate/nitrite transporter NrtS [Rhodospirillales bacterium]